LIYNWFHMIKKILLFAFILLLIIPIGVWFWLKSAHSPEYEGSKQLVGLQQEATVIFDSHGVPHIIAQSGNDAYITLGYVHAQDRIFQMDLMRRVGGGRLAALLGKDLVKVDQFFRVLGLADHAKWSAAEAENAGQNSEWLALTMAYLDGVNTFIAEGNFPLEYRLLGSKPEPFTLQNVHEIAGYMSFTFAMALKSEPVTTLIAQQLGKDYLSDLSIEPLEEHTKIPTNSPNRTEEGLILSGIHDVMGLLPVAPFIGSNAWVVSADKSASGSVIFCNDTHIGFSQPSVWYEAHISYPGFDFYGNHLAGVPFPLIGHSRGHSYGLTMFENDDFDLYAEKIDPSNASQVLVGDTFEPILSKSDTIFVKNGAPVVIEIKSTPRGNIINEILPELEEVTEAPVSAWWVFLKEPSTALQAIHKLSRAKNINEFESGVKLIHAPGLNVMYGDTSGNIAWWAAAKIPVRQEGVSTKFILDASEVSAPMEYHPFESNPMSINPPEGFVYSANNMPDTTDKGLVVPGYYYPGDRGWEIIQFLSEDKKFSAEDMKSLQLQNHNSRHQRIAAEIANVLTKNMGLSGPVLTLLSDWNGDHSAKSQGATIYHKLVYNALMMKMGDEIGEEWVERYLKTFLSIRSLEGQFLNDLSPWWDDIDTEEKESRKEILEKAYTKTLSELEKQLGKDPQKWHWERVISVEHEHALGSKKPLNKLFNVGPLFITGNKEAVNKLDFHWNKEGKYKVHSGPAMRIIVDFANVNDSESIIPTGQSGNVFSPYYKDQADMFAKGEYRKQLMDLNEVKSGAHKTLQFKPL